MRIQPFSISGLGHQSSLIADEAAGVAAVIDPRRDVDIYLETARDQGVRITHVVETHLHNDYVSGGRDLASLTGATHVIGAGAALRYEHQGVADGAGFDVGALRFETLDTPGHTPEHVSYTVTDTARADDPGLVLSGGSLLVGAVGRTDLLGAENAIPFAHAMYHSLHDVLLRLDDDVAVHPTHGAGSLCSVGIGTAPTTTIGRERRFDPLLAPMDIDAFARALLVGQPAIPRYFARMRPINQGGPPLLGGIVPMPPAMTPSAVETAVASGARIVDARPAAEHVAGHIPGSLSIPVDDGFGTWLGWVLDLDQPVVLLTASDGDVEPLMRQAIRIGHDGVIGRLDGGYAAWVASGRPTEASGSWSATELATALASRPADEAPLVIDVRQAFEYDAGHVPGAWHINGGSLPDRLADLPRDRDIACVCAAGFRASIATSILRAAGFDRAAWVGEGFPAWQAAGLPIETGSAGGRGPA
jgi:hydroxyacylglutathione hydrolase